MLLLFPGLIVRAGGDFRCFQTGAVVRGRPRHTDLLVFVLELVELIVNTAIGEQLLVSSHFAHLAFVHHDDLVGALHGREAVGDDHRRRR